MDRDQDGRMNENDIDQLVKRAFGMDDDRLLRDFLLAQTEIKDSQIPPEPEDGFKRLLEKIEERGIKPRYSDEDSAAWPDRSSRRPLHLRPAFKAALAAGVIAVMLMAMGITAGAKRDYSFSVKERNDVRNDLLLNNVDMKIVQDNLKSAYIEIYNKTGINVLKLGYIPQGMEYIKTAISQNRATMYFEYNGNRFYVIQQIRSKDNMVNSVSDRTPSEEVYNSWLKRNISIEKAVTEDNETEISAIIVDDDSYYQLFGIIDEGEFKKIINEVYLEN